jgi:TolB-like protein
VGCAGPARLYVNPQADLTLYHKIAVIPFNNLTPQNYAGDRVTRAFVTELIMTDRFQVVEPAEFRAAMDRAGVESSESDTYQERLKAAADAVQATGVVRGAVSEYEMRRAGQDEVPVVGLDVELLDAATGNVVWRVAVNRKGRGHLPVFGAGARTFGRVTQEACAAAVAALRGKAF